MLLGKPAQYSAVAWQPIPKEKIFQRWRDQIDIIVKIDKFFTEIFYRMQIILYRMRTEEWEMFRVDIIFMADKSSLGFASSSQEGYCPQVTEDTLPTHDANFSIPRN